MRRGRYIPAMARRFVEAVLASFGMLACGGPSPEPPGTRLVLAAAADLAAALPELTGAFESATGMRVTATVAASGQLAQQIRNGAPIDVFASADRGWVEWLAREGRIVDGTATVYARGRLVLLEPHGAPVRLDSLADLDRPAVRRIAIANPEHAPYGRAARQALERAGLWQRLQPKIVIAENVRQTVQFAQTGNVDAAVTALSLMSDDLGRWTELPASLHEPLDQTVAVVAGRPYEHEARAFVAFLTGGEGRRILKAHMLHPPDPQP